MTTKHERWRVLINEVVDYEQTVSALLAFAALVAHDGKSRRQHAEFGFGRRMTKVQQNGPTTEVTPDLVAQKSLSYGVVAEAKKSLPRDTTQWLERVRQLRSYDHEFLGWWTESETIANSDTVMLIHQSRSREFASLLEAQQRENPDSVGPRTSVVEFNESTETVIYYFFRREFGTISDVGLAGLLENGKQVPLDDVVQSFSNIRYYDAKPPLVHLLNQLWTDYFPSLLTGSQYDERIKANRIEVSVSETAQELQAAYGSGAGALRRDQRSALFPKPSWVAEAFDWLVSHRLAIPQLMAATSMSFRTRGFGDRMCGNGSRKCRRAKKIAHLSSRKNNCHFFLSLQKKSETPQLTM